MVQPESQFGDHLPHIKLLTLKQDLELHLFEQHVKIAKKNANLYVKHKL